MVSVSMIQKPSLKGAVQGNSHKNSLLSPEEHDQRMQSESANRSTKIKKYLLDLAHQRALNIREKEKALQMEQQSDKN